MRYHRYLDDYHGFNGSTLDILFPGTESIEIAWSTTPSNKFYPYDPELDGKLSKQIEAIRYLLYLLLHNLRSKYVK